MFIGIIEKDGQTNAKLYYSFDEWHKDTFCPDCDYWTIPFKIRGNNYNQRKERLREIARDYSLIAGDLTLYWSEFAEITDFFRRNGRKYGCLKEFHENAIC